MSKYRVAVKWVYDLGRLNILLIYLLHICVVVDNNKNFTCFLSFKNKYHRWLYSNANRILIDDWWAEYVLKSFVAKTRRGSSALVSSFTHQNFKKLAK